MTEDADEPTTTPTGESTGMNATAATPNVTKNVVMTNTTTNGTTRDMAPKTNIAQASIEDADTTDVSASTKQFFVDAENEKNNSNKSPLTESATNGTTRNAMLIGVADTTDASTAPLAELVPATPESVEHSAVSAPAESDFTVESSDVALRRRLDELEDAAQQYVRRPDETTRAYAADWRAWLRYCAELRIPPTTATTGAFVGFVAWHVRLERAPATIERRVYGVLMTMRDLGLEVTPVAVGTAMVALAQYVRELAEHNVRRGRGQARAVTVPQLREICAALPDTLAGVRDRAVVLLGFALGARRSELANLDVTDVVEEEQGLVVTIRFGKTGARTVHVLRGTHPPTCPVRAVLAWIAAAGLVNGALFRSISKHGAVGTTHLLGKAISEIIARAAKTAGLPTRLTGHSVRSGLATEARRAGHDAKIIAAQGGWRHFDLSFTPNNAFLDAENGDRPNRTIAVR